ncbi:DUF6340 family protein [uncultured Draconibacterium sp.]|uniref:DUF6340 family protein n=1 Tax=uncultured Draconibacterium sp. TaxID=1573823 RepID=UPI0025E5EAAC|nr:DUF6340 family protein [uncultured Draconibacterium sp.]
MHLSKYTNYMVLIGIVILSYACSSTKRILVEFPQKPKNDIPQNIQSLLLVNRTVDNTYTNFQKDSLQRIFYKNDFNLDTTIFDLTSVDTSLVALGELLFESGRFDFVIPENRHLSASKNAFFTSAMNWNEVREMCELYHTDAVLSMDMYKTRVITKLEEESVFDPNQGFFISAVGAQMVVVYEALYRLYDPQTEKIIAREVFKDTLMWEDIALNVRDLFSDFTPVKQALTEAGIALALDFSEQISTGWRSEYRMIFKSGSAELKQAALYTDSNEWDKAIAAWEKIAQGSDSKSVKSKALFNLAIACEIEGDIDCAIQKALDSYNIAYHPLTYQYLELLERKKKNLKKH